MSTSKPRSSRRRTTTRAGSKKSKRSNKLYVTSTVRSAADWALNNQWLKEWGGWATRFDPHELITTAQSYRKRWEKDLTHLANYVTKRVKEIDWIEKAREVTQTGVTDLVSYLNIPSQGEVERLHRKLDALEQRINAVMLRRAPKR